MRKLAIVAVAVLGYGAFYAANSHSEVSGCTVIKDFDDASDFGLKVLEANPQVWRDYYATTTDMRRSATYGRMGLPGKMKNITLTGVKEGWSYQLNLECTSDGNSKWCKHVTVKFNSCGQMM